MTDHSWLWLNEELSDVKIRLVCMGAHAPAPAAQQVEQAAGKLAACNGRSYATACAYGQVAGTTQAMHDPMHMSMPTAAGGQALEGGHEKDAETCVELPAHAAVLASESGYWKARILRWRKGRNTPEPAAAGVLSATGSAAALTEAPTAGTVANETGETAEQGEGGEGSEVEHCVNATTVAALAPAAPSPATTLTAQTGQVDTAALQAPSSPTATLQSGLGVEELATPAMTTAPPKAQAAQSGFEEDTISAQVAAPPVPTTARAGLKGRTATTAVAPAAPSPAPTTAQIAESGVGTGAAAATAATAAAAPSRLGVDAAAPTPLTPPTPAVRVEGHADRAAAATAARGTSMLLPTHHSSVVLLEEVNNPQQLEAARYVLQYAYTHELPEHAAPHTLIQVALHADRWDMPQALEACLESLADIGLGAHDVNVLLSEDLPSTITAHARYTSVVNNCTATLIAQFGRAQAVAAQPQLLKQFCSLSLKAVQLWAEQDTLEIDSENTVAVLFTYWWHNNSSGFDGQQEASACKVLTESIQADQLSSTFVLDTLETLPWFKPTQKAFRTLKLLHGHLHQQRDLVKGVLPEAWCLDDARTEDDEQETQLEWIVTRRDLDQLHQKAGHGRAIMHSTTSLYWAGYKWHLALLLNDQKAALYVGVLYTSAMPHGSPADGVPPVLPATFDLLVLKQDGQDEESFEYDYSWPMCTEVCGTEDLLEVEASANARTNSYPPNHLWKDGKLHLQLRMLTVQ